MKRTAMIIRPGALGDTLMLMPALAQMRTRVDVVLVGRYPGIDFLKSHVHLSVDMEGPGWHQLFLDHMETPTPLAVPSVDPLVAFLGDPDGSLLRNLKALFPGTSIRIFPSLPPKDKRIHVAFYLAECLQKGGLPVDPGGSFSEAQRRPLLLNTPCKRSKAEIILHPGSGGRKKNYSPGFWVNLIKAIESRFSLKWGENIQILLGPAEEGLRPHFQGHLKGIEEGLILSPSKEGLLSLFTRASLYIGHDSGITHLSAMLGTPTIALFREASSDLWRPLGPDVTLFREESSETRLIGKILDHMKSEGLRPKAQGSRRKQ